MSPVPRVPGTRRRRPRRPRHWPPHPLGSGSAVLSRATHGSSLACRPPSALAHDPLRDVCHRGVTKVFPDPRRPRFRGKADGPSGHLGEGLRVPTVASRRRVRRLVVGGAVYGWCFAHRHDRVRGYPGCSSTVTLWRRGGSGHLRLVFRPEHDRVIADGYFDEGAAVRLPDRACLNLYEPGSVRALLEEAVVGGLWPAAGTVEVDGWPLFDAVTPLDPPNRL